MITETRNILATCCGIMLALIEQGEFRVGVREDGCTTVLLRSLQHYFTFCPFCGERVAPPEKPKLEEKGKKK